MSFYEILTLGGVMATILGVFLTLYAVINNKTLKAEARNTNELINQFRKEHRETIAEFRREHNETMRIMSEKLDEFRREHRETIDEFRKSHDETIKYIANLIVANGERTRQEIRKKARR